MRAFTLLELLVVLIIVGILAGIAIPNYTKTSERAKNREAQTALSLIQAAERIYRLRNPTYYGSLVLNDINNNLKLSLSSQAWTYSIVAVANTFTASARRSPTGTPWDRRWDIDQDDNGPTTCVELGSADGCP